MKRDVSQVVAGNRAVDGAGVNLVRVLGRETTRDFDPFLMLDAFDSTDPRDYVKGFPWHPHRGIETVTYLVSGHIEHGDSLGNQGDIRDGGCQWMTAGSGIMHQEMPKASPRMLGLQLWLNLPRKDKMTPPKYHDIVAKDVPVAAGDGARVRVIAGEYAGARGVMTGDHVHMTMLDVELQPGKAFRMDTPEGETAFAYLMAGAGAFGASGMKLEEKRAALFSPGTELSFTAGDQGLRLVLFMAAPLHEPIAWGGPIVMNTREELQQAFEELDRGTFVRS